MCLLITLLAAIISSVVWYRQKPAGYYKMETLCLMYWGAALMWTVDAVFAAFAGESPLDFSMAEVFLGILVVTAGLLVWSALVLSGKGSSASQKA